MFKQLSSNDDHHLGLPDADTAYLVGVSGGRDSMVLLHWLLEQGYRQQLIVCHVNHGLRGEESDGDQELVERIAQAEGLECVCERYDVAAIAASEKQSIETAARGVRYRFFAKVAEARGCSRVILAHHADDQVETVLMNLFRGTALKGLGGIAAVSRREGLEIYRPFLSVTRAELIEYQQEHGVEYREDSTNGESIAVRNRMRLELLPLAQDIFGRDVSPAVLRLAELAQEESADAHSRAEVWVKANIDQQLALPVAELRQLLPSELQHVLHFWLRMHCVCDIQHREIKAICEIVQSQDKPAKTNLSGGRHVRRRAGVLFVE